MAFIQDPRLRQRWNQLSHTTEAVTSDAAAGIWTFGHRYLTPCLDSLCGALDACAGRVCLGGSRDERARRARERDRGARGTRAARAEYSFDFYDDWEEDFPGEVFPAGYAGEEGGEQHHSQRGGGLLGWGGEDWDRLLAGTGAGGRGAGAEGGEGVVDQPRRKRGMSYGTRGGVRKVSSGEEDDPNVIPRTAPLGFLARLPFKIVGSLRYKPSAANLREHPAGGGLGQGIQGDGDAGELEEHEPLLGTGDEEGRRHRGSPPRQRQRPRSDTTNSGDTSSSYRSRGDLFPSDGEGDEDAVPLDDEFTVALERVDDRGSTKTRSSKGKRPADRDRDRDRLSRTVSRTTMSSTNTPDEHRWGSSPVSPSWETADALRVPSMEDLQREEEEAEREEYEEYERKRRAASQLAAQRGLSKDDLDSMPDTLDEPKDESLHQGLQSPPAEESAPIVNGTTADDEELDDVEEPKPPPAMAPESDTPQTKMNGAARGESTFVPARLPHFG